MAKWPYGTAQWQRLRRAHLDQFPQCEGCEQMGILSQAVAVDHRVAISEGGAAFPGHDGLASYCTACHSAKTVRGAEAGAVRTRKPRRGCNASGEPLDRTHEWRAKSLRAADVEPSFPHSLELVRFSTGNQDHG